MIDMPPGLVGYQLNIGSAQPGWFNVDNRYSLGIDLVWDLEEIPWPLADASAIVGQAGHIVSRINPARWGFLAFMDECWRILRPGAPLGIVTYYGANTHFQADPAACNPITEATWMHFDPEHRSTLWQRYQPLPWRLAEIGWEVAGNIEVVLVKR
jgi:hypothetical protein